ncbi:MAG: cytochrome b/b6 domain-containing protein [Planctomycetes bacterium]|nr:cytochrome b/b6 domain-containing protein [Planctomycetota bacterium]
MSGARDEGTVLRFGPTERVYHWAQALPYFTLLGSGGLLLASRRFGVAIAGEDTLVLIHKIAGWALPAALLLVFVGGDTRTLLRNACVALCFGRSDLAWLLFAPVRALSPCHKAPPCGKFNPGQKVHMLALMALIPLFFATGLLMWYWPGALLPWYTHVICAALAVPLLLGHLFLALVLPATRQALPAVFTGRVDARYAREHHALECAAPGKEGEGRP